LGRDGVNRKAESNTLRKLQTAFSFTLHVHERVSRREKIRVQVLAAERGKRQIAGLVCDIEGATHQFAASADMCRPGHDDVAEQHVGPRLEAPQPALFDQLIAEPTKSSPRLVVAEARPGYDAKVFVGCA